MGFRAHGYSGTVADVSGTGARALKVEPRPLDVQGLGAYRSAVLSGTFTGASNSDAWSMRWSDATKLALIHKVTLDGLAGTSTAFLAGLAFVKLSIVRAHLADGSGGNRFPANTSTGTGNVGKTRTPHNSETVGEIRWGATGGGSVGTGTLDSQPVGQYTFTVPNAGSRILAKQVTLFGGQHPIVLAANEGLAARMTLPGSGTWHHGFTVVWSEVTSY